MAASTFVSRLSCRSSSLASKFTSRSVKPSVSPLKPCSQSQISASTKRTSRIPRLPVQLSSLISMMPLHSAIASARLTSVLSMESQSWGLVPQGYSLGCSGATISELVFLDWRQHQLIINQKGLVTDKRKSIPSASVYIRHLYAFMTACGSFNRIITDWNPIEHGSSILLKFMEDVN